MDGVGLVMLEALATNSLPFHSHTFILHFISFPIFRGQFMSFHMRQGTCLTLNIPITVIGTGRTDTLVPLIAYTLARVGAAYKHQHNPEHL